MNDWTATAHADDFPDELLLHDLTVLDEIANPLRSALLFRLRRPQSAAELATAMDVPVTRLYHHLNRLTELGLIHVVATRRSGAKTERRYRTVASGFRLDPSIVESVDSGDFARTLGSLFDLAKHEMLGEFASGALSPSTMRGMSTFGLNELILTPDQRHEFVQKLGALIEEYITLDAVPDDAASDVHRFRVFVAGFPVTS